jgi:GGDEF domain-containing protein
MTQGHFFEPASGILTRDAFNFMADHQLRYAQRTQEFVTLVVITAERESRELLVAADEWMMRELGRVIRCVVRNTDLVGRTADGTLCLLLSGIDTGRAAPVIDRLYEHLSRYRTSPLQINVGAACCPTHASCSDELFRQALSSRTPRLEKR